MNGHLATRSLTIVGLLLLSFFTAPANAQDAGGQDTSCCSDTSFDLFLLDESSNGKLSPFENELSDEQEATVTAGLQQGEVEVGSWEIIWGTEGDYPAETWTFTIPYLVEGAVGVTINATLDIRIGGSFYSGNSGLNGVEPFLNAEGNMEINVEVSSGTINEGDKLEVSLFVNSLLFSNPTQDAGLTFKWGSEDSIAVSYTHLTLPTKA